MSAPSFLILYDEPQESAWFRSLHPSLAKVPDSTITGYRGTPLLKQVLSYDRPDIVLLDGGDPILVIEETVEVPSGHNVGQRFARLAAAAENGVPCLYFGPYVAKKHGGKTAGPRYMNVRLFHSLDAMTRVTGSAATTICWPVDSQYEVRRDAAKDKDVRSYMAMFLSEYATKGSTGINKAILTSPIHLRMLQERDQFVKTQIRNPGQYNGPPNSVSIEPVAIFSKAHGVSASKIPAHVKEVVVYNVGMNYIRSDPYTGMAILYHYLYIAEHSDRALVLWFPNISHAEWKRAAKNSRRKDVRLYKVAAEAILFSDAFVLKQHL